MKEIYDALNGAADGALIIDEKLRIQFWNRAAEQITGFGKGDVIGQKCYHIFQGRDEKRRLICKAGCHVAELALKSEPVYNYDIRTRTNNGDRRWLNVSVITSKMGQNRNKKMIVHLFRDVTQRKDGEMFLRRILEMAQRYHIIPFEPGERKDPDRHIDKLTPRQREVLTLLVRGLSTKEIAEALFISMSTVRNHVQHIFDKLGVHSRPEAIVYAYQNELIRGNEIWD
jgi:PAS domain S-box-containing protein